MTSTPLESTTTASPEHSSRRSATRISHGNAPSPSGVGLDANFFNDRLRVNFDWYNKNTDNVIYAVPVTYLVGVTSIYRNIGKMRNRGIELTIGGEIIATRDWTWSLEANLTTNKTSSATSTSRKKPTAQWWSSP